jgi:predicted porin
VIDPFGGDTVAGLRNSSMTAGGVAKTRVSDSVRYEFAAEGARIVATVAEANQAAAANVGPDRPWSLAANYTAGPLFIGAGYEDPAGANDRILNVGARYTFGPATLRAGLSDARNNADQKIRGYIIGANVKAGPGEVLVGYATSKNRTLDTDLSKKFGLGYRHPLSKRTFLYTDIARDSVFTTSKTGYDLGIQHNF